MISNLLVVFITLIFSAFFSGMEIAFVSSNKLRIELEKKQGQLSSRIISIFTKNPGQYIATMLIGNNIALVTYGLFMAIILEPYIEHYITSIEFAVLTIQTIFSTLLILITAEFLPKILFRRNPNNILRVFSFPVFIFYLLFYPITKLSVAFSNTLLRRLLKVNITKQQTTTVFGKVDLDHFLNESQKAFSEDDEIEHDIRIFQNALDFTNVRLRECSVPRNEIVAMELLTSVKALKEKFIETGYSKILIYENSIDNIIGYVHSSSLFKNPEDIKSVLVKLLIVPETMPANKMLNDFIKERKSVALVVDEFGGTSGMVTIEDIMEEIFGEIEDEHDTSDLIDKQTGENEYLFSGRLEIDYINNKYNLKLPESENYETLAGYILDQYEKLPVVNEEIILKPFILKIIKISKPRIDLIQLRLIEKPL